MEKRKAYSHDVTNRRRVQATAHIYAYHDDDRPVLVVEGLVTGEGGDDGEPLLRQEVALALEQPGPVRSAVLQPASSSYTVQHVKIHHKPCGEQSNHQITSKHRGALGLTNRKIPVLFSRSALTVRFFLGSYATERQERRTRTKQKQERKTKLLDDPVLVLSGKLKNNWQGMYSYINDILFYDDPHKNLKIMPTIRTGR